MYAFFGCLQGLENAIKGVFPVLKQFQFVIGRNWESGMFFYERPDLAHPFTKGWHGGL